jgi:hypothetical protein
MPKEGLHRGNLPGLRGDATELKLDTMFQPGAAGVSKFAPRADDEGEARVADEVITGKPFLELLRGEDNEEVLGVVKMACRTCATCAAETAGLVPVTEATIARRSTCSASSISMLRETMTRTGFGESTARASGGAAGTRTGPRGSTVHANVVTTGGCCG